MGTKLSNVIGAPFANHVLKQLYVRAYHNSTGTTLLGSSNSIRTNEEVLFLANKMAWARLISSVDVITPSTSDSSTDKKGVVVSSPDYSAFIKQLGIVGSGNYSAPNSLAKNWVLQAGTSVQNKDDNGITLRQGFGPDGAYGLGGTEELGFRPMPGLTSITVETQGRLGSLRQATINFKVWNMDQLNVIEALYFRLGYSMLLEWGHVQYFNNAESSFLERDAGVFTTKDIHGVDDPFTPNSRKEKIQQEIAKKQYQASGNYDGMLGIVSNFSWSFNQDGGFDCTVRLIGLGAVMDSLRINQAYKLPSGILSRLKTAQDDIGTYLAQQAKRLAEQAAQQYAPTPKEETFDPTPTSVNDLFQREKAYNSKPEDYSFQDYNKDYSALSFVDFSGTKQNPRVYYNLFDNLNVETSVLNGAKKRYEGLWLAYTNGLYRVGEGTNVNLNTTELGNAIIYGNNIVEKDVDLSKQVGSNTFSEFFDYKNSYYYKTQLRSGQQVKISVDIEQPYPFNSGDLTTSFRSSYKWDPNTDVEVYFSVQPKIDGANEYFPVTRRSLINGLDQWIADGAPALITNTSFKKGDTFVTIKGQFKSKLTILSSTKLIDDRVESGKLSRANAKLISPKEDVTITWSFVTNNPGFISQVGSTESQDETQGNAPSAANTGDDSGQLNQADGVQTDSVTGFESALHAMLTAIQTTSQAAAINKASVSAISIKETTQAFYADGIFNLTISGSTSISNPANVPFDLTLYSQKGFNSELMVNPGKFEEIPYIGGKKDKANFDNFCKSIVIKYKQHNIEGDTQYPGQFPVYISLGYLLAFLNNMCLFYDSNQATPSTNQSKANEQRPYIYIDFNPETNFCLTSPQQFSTDPLICLIPASLDQDQYLNIFPPDSIKLESPFNPKSENSVSAVLNGSGFTFQGVSAYQGKTMNIMLTTQYLLRILREFTTADPQHSVSLQPFLERIMTDVNKCLGNINLFRVAYRDDTNTVQIQDDQFTEPLAGEPSMLNKNQFLNNLKTNVIESGQLPIFASQGRDPEGRPVDVPSQGIARNFELRSVMSTKLASMVAISAQANTGSVNATDHSSLSWLNQRYQDRYKPYIQDQSNGSSGKNNNKTTKAGSSNDQVAADQFNAHVKSVYTNLDLSEDRTEPAKNYYIERMSKVKSGDRLTSSAPFIPAELEITLDGISGVIMGNAFTIPESRLPLSLRSEDSGFAKVGFIVNGLTHTIENNEWLTKIKGQMIKLRESDTLGVAPRLASGPQTGAESITNSSFNSRRTVSLTNVTPQLQILWDKFKAAGLSQAAAAGVAGTLYAESGFKYDAWIKGATKQGGTVTTVDAGSGKGMNLDPQISGKFVRPTYNSGSSITAYGMPQWVGTRLDAYVKFANSNGGDSFATQIAFIVEELKTTNKNAYSKLKNIPNTDIGAAQAALIWLDYYEFAKPFITDEEPRNRRVSFANGAWNIIKNFT